MIRPLVNQSIRTVRVALIAGVLALYGLSGCATAVSGQDKSGFQEQTVSIAAGDLSLSGVLFTPDHSNGAPSRRPAIVLLHGCGGMFDSRNRLAPRHRDWAERFASWGFVTLLLDSFSPRAIKSLCELKDRPIHPWRERSLDGYSALAFLAARRQAQPSRPPSRSIRAATHRWHRPVIARPYPC